MKKGIIYFASNKINHKVYIGQTGNKLEARLKIHLKDSRKRYFQNSLKKHELINFNFGTIEYPIEKLNEMEIYWIKKLNTKYPNGYNLTEGGGGTRGYKFTNEQKEKYSKILKENYKNNPERSINISKSLKNNYINNFELKEKLSKSQKNRWKKPEKRLIQSIKLKKAWKNIEVIKKCSIKSKEMWKDPKYRKKISKSLKDKGCKKFIFTDPGGKKYLITNGFEKFCNINNLNNKSMWSILYNKSSCFGWKVSYA